MTPKSLKTTTIPLYFGKQPALARYGLSLLFVAIAAGATQHIPVIGERAVFLLFFFAIIQSTYWFGLYPGILAMCLSFIAANTLAMLPLWASNPEETLFLNAGFGILAAIFIIIANLHRNLTAALLVKQQDLNRAEMIGRTGNWRMDVLHNELHWSDENYRIFGIPKGTALTYEAFLAMVHPEDLDFVNQQWQAALHGEPYDIDHRIIVDGKVKWVCERAELEFGDNGKLLGGFGTTQDITDLKQAERELLESKRRYVEIVESSMDAMVTIDAEQRIVLFNAAAEKMFGCKMEEALGTTIEHFIPERFSHDHHGHTLSFVESGITSRRMGKLGKVMALRANGDKFPVEASISFCESDGMKLFTTIMRDVSDRESAERLQQEQFKLQDQLTKVAASVPGVICSFRLSPDGLVNVPYASPSIESVIGLSHKQIANDVTPVFARVHPTDIGHINGSIKESARTLKALEETFRYNHPQKGEIWIEGRSMPSRESDGSLLWHGYIQDVTERVRAELQLQDSMARHELVLDGAQDAIWDWDVRNKRVHYSSRWKALRGFSDDEVGDHEEEWSAHIHPNDKERVFAAVTRHFARETPFFCEEYQIRCKDGTWKWILDRGVAQWDNEGKAIRMAGSESDITSRKLAEQALQHRENELRLIMDATPALISYLDTDFRYVRVNKTYENWFCLPAENILGREARDIVGEKAWGIVQPYLERARRGERVNFDYQVPYGANLPRWVHGNYIPDKDPTGVVRGIVVHIVDIEERKQAENEIHLLNQNLQRSIEEMQVLFDTAPIGLAIADDPDGYHIRGNPANEKLLGLPPGSELSKRGGSIAPYRVIQGMHELAVDQLPMQQAIRGKTVANQILEALRPDGTNVILLANAAPLYDETGTPRGAIGAFLDITELKRNEKLIRENEERMRLATETTGVGIWEWNVFTNQIHWDAEMFRIYGITPTQDGLVDYRTWSSYVVPEDLPQQEAVLQGIVKQGGRSSREFRIHRAGGNETRFVQAIETVRTNGLGQVEWVVGTNLDITELKNTTLAFQASEARVALGIEVAGLALAEVDYESGLNHFTPQAAQLFGFGEVELTLPRSAVHATFHLEDREELMRRIAKALDPAGDGWFEMDHRVVLPDGIIRWLRVRKRVFFSEDGNTRRPLRAILAMHDITERKQASETIRASEAFVRSVLNSLPEHVVVLDASGIVTAVNEPWERFARENDGSPHAVSVGANYLDVCRRSSAAGDPYAHQALLGLEDLVADRRQEFIMEYPCPTPTFNRWFLMHAKRVHRGIDGIILSHVDITERKQTEDELINAQARLALVIGEVKAAYWDWDLKTNALYLSPEWSQHLGLDKEESFVVWNRENDRLHPEDRALVKEATENYIAGGQSKFEIQFRLRHKDGSYRWIHSHGALLRDPHSQPCRMLGLNLDITDYKKEKEINERRDEMEKSFRLYIATQTAAAIAHELNQPLTAISYYAYVAQNMLKSSNQNPQKLASVMEKCGQQAQRAGDVIQQLLALLHKGEVVSEPVDINMSVYNAIDFIKVQDQASAFKIEINVTEDLPLVTANTLQVQKVLVNLLNNGLEAMADCGRIEGTISVTTQRYASDPALVQVSVSDSGTGAADNDSLIKIFQPFYSTKPKGLGMGLAISRALIEAHGGKMWAEQNPDFGLSVIFTLPFIK